MQYIPPIALHHYFPHSALFRSQNTQGEYFPRVSAVLDLLRATHYSVRTSMFHSPHPEKSELGNFPNSNNTQLIIDKFAVICYVLGTARWTRVVMRIIYNCDKVF